MTKERSPSTRRYAILGVTGATGRALLKYLLRQTDVHLHVYARSAARVQAQNPGLETNPAVTIHTGDLTDIPLLASCIRECSIVFSVLATNVNEPGMTIAQRAAHSITSALQVLRGEAKASTHNSGEQTWTCPTSHCPISGPRQPKAKRRYVSYLQPLRIRMSLSPIFRSHSSGRVLPKRISMDPHDPINAWRPSRSSTE